MCDPISMTVIAVASTAASLISQSQQAHHQADQINAQNAAKQKQIDQATTAQINDRLREARREQGRIVVAAGEAGLSLQSGNVEGLLMDSAQQAGLADNRSLANRESAKIAASAEAQAAMPSSPTLLGAGLQIAAAGASTYASAKGRANAAGG